MLQKFSNMSILSEHYILLSIISLLSFGIWINLSPVYGYPKLFVYWRWITLTVLVNGFILYNVDGCDQVQFFNNFFQTEWKDYQAGMLLWSLALILMCFNFNYSFEFFILFLISFWSSLMIINTVDFIMFYFLLELQSMSFYILAAWRKNKRISIEGGLKYFFLSSFASIIILFGFSFLYSFCGLTNINDIALVQWNSPSDQLLSLIMVSVGFLFKLYCAPFHYWVADIYEGTTTVVVSAFTILSLLTFYHFLSKLLFSVYFPFMEYWQMLLSYIIPLTLLVGTLGAFYQMKIKRVLAYSSISNIGYFLMSLFYMDVSFINNTYGYIFFYTLSSVLLLLASSILIPLESNRLFHENVENWGSWLGLHKINWWLTLVLVILVFSLSGIPPFGVFFGKWYLLSNLFLWKNYWWMFLSITMTLFTFYYYVRIVKVVSYGKLTSSSLILKQINSVAIFTLISLLGVLVWISILFYM